MELRPDPEQLLQRVQAEEREKRRGRLKVFLGYYSGVGKSYRMLDEGRRRAERGQDVVVGAIQAKTEGAANAVLEQMEIIPMLQADGLPVMNLQAILDRKPEICLVDGLAYDNPPGSSHTHRWQEIESLLEAGISVITTVNLQFIAEQRAAVERITGRWQSQSVPQEVLYKAEEIELVDAPPEILGTHSGLARLTSPAASAENQKMLELRELALLLAADVVDRQLETYLQFHGILGLPGTQERILVCVTPWFDAQAMIDSGKRNADRFRGELIIAYVSQPRLLTTEERRIAENLARARAAGAEVAILEESKFVDGILKFARTRGVTQIFVGHSRHVRWWARLAGRQLDRLIESATDMDVRVFPH